MALFGARGASGALFFDGIYGVFCTSLNFHLKNATSKSIKKSQKNRFLPGVWLFGGSAPCPKLAPPKGHFWRYLRCFMHIEHSSKKSRFCASGGGSAAGGRPPIAKAKATPHAMRFNMPGIRCLVHRRIKQASACQPPTREICCIGPGSVDSWEKEVYIVLDIMYIYIYIFMYILKA